MSDYPSLVRITVPVSLKDILGAFEFVCAASGGEHEAFLCRQSGKLYCHSELCDDFDILPDDTGDSEKFLQIPDKRELDLGKPLALDFARQLLPGDFDDVVQFFRGRGAYARFKAFSRDLGLQKRSHIVVLETEERKEATMIGNKLKVARSASGLSLRALADAMDGLVSAQGIGK